VASLRRFYDWAKLKGFIAKTPFELFDFDRPLLPRDQVRRREATTDEDPNQREITRLEALNQLADDLNRSTEAPCLLDSALKTLVKVMGLKTGWVFLWKGGEFQMPCAPGDADADFTLVAHCGLPPGFRADNYHYLRCSPECYCQELLREGGLVRAVNVFECTRLMDAAEANMDTEGLLFHATVPLIAEGKILGLIDVATENWEFLSASDLQFLTAAAGMIATAMERTRLYHEVEAQRTRLAQELEMARNVQASLIPKQMPAVAGFDIAAAWQAAFEVAGDFYDGFELANGKTAIVLGDVSGKGAPAALYMAMVRSLIRTESERYTSAADLLREVNRHLRTQGSSDMFVTVFFAVIDPDADRILYCNAGHDPPVLRRSCGEVSRFPYGGHLLGVLNDPDLSDESVDLQSGDTLVVFTDGLVDAINTDAHQYGVSRLLGHLHDCPSSAQDTVTHLMRGVTDFIGPTPQLDDITVLVIKRW
jgi:serine phosphatase RsbU (regulator of sigma subunit)